MHRSHALRRIFAPRLQALVVLVTSAAALTIGAPPTRATTSTVTIGGPFTLTAHDGATVTDRTYRGKWLLVFFGFTFCPNTCPMTLFEIAATLEQLGPEAGRVQPIFITVDPQRDTPAVMAGFVQSFDPRIVGLTGTGQQIAAVAQEYGAYYAPHRYGPRPDDYVMDHGTYLYLMDPHGQFVRAFDADTSGGRLAGALREVWRKAAGQAGSERPTSVARMSA